MGAFIHLPSITFSNITCFVIYIYIYIGRKYGAVMLLSPMTLTVTLRFGLYRCGATLHSNNPISLS